MSRKCELTGVGVQYGNNVSHSQRKTRRRFEPNVKSVVYSSELTGEKYRMKIVVKTMRTIEKFGGFDAFMLGAKDSLMSIKAKKVKREIAKKQTEKTEASA
ncbi:MAG: 50S ribosomal protein L28 [Rickettsiales bacterium]|nr:MAG: 50S ribosomal protein L28 [Rickettsiales bacterium]